jgi:hypothetical protein
MDKAKKTGKMRKKILTGLMENDLIRKIKLKNFGESVRSIELY